MAQVDVSIDGDLCTVTLNKAERHNSLTLPFMRAVEGALAQACGSDAHLILLKAEGRSFSTGGDITGFLEQAENSAALQDYAAELVGSLNRSLVAMITAPQPIFVAAQGLVTGGAAGFLFASDTCLMAEKAFLQPYYGEVGFAPDGGWTALLPSIIAPRRAMDIISQNRRVSALEALEMGIVDAVADADAFPTQTVAICDRILSQDTETLAQAKKLIWTKDRYEQASRGLEAERQAFLQAITKPSCIEKMKAFLAPRKKASTA